MIDIKIPKEVKKYKEKLFFGLNLRQCICTAIAIIINTPLYWFGRNFLGEDLVSWLVIFNAIPLFAIGFINYNGMNFENLIVTIVKFNFINPRIRKFKTENLFYYIDKSKENKKK